VKNHFIFVEEDGSVTWSSNPMKLWREEGDPVTPGSEIKLGDSVWKLVEQEGRLSLELANRGQWKTTKGLQRGGLYKIQPKVVMTIVKNAARGKKGFEPRKAVRLAPSPA
jgi:hypothetical protein